MRDSNECSVETLIGDVNYVKGTRRNRLEYENLQSQIFVKRNGPHPLLSETLRKDALNFMYLNGWQFTKPKTFGCFASTAYNNVLKQAKLQNTYCFN